MSDVQATPAPPAAYDVVQIIDLQTATRVNAVVHSADADRYVLHLERPSTVPHEAPVRWFDGDTAWQAISKLERIDESSVICQLAPSPQWESAPVRQSLRAQVDNAPMLARVADSQALTRGRIVHAVCLDVSASGCRVNWPGSTPSVDDRVELAWDVGDWQRGSAARLDPGTCRSYRAHAFRHAPGRAEVRDDRCGASLACPRVVPQVAAGAPPTRKSSSNGLAPFASTAARMSAMRVGRRFRSPNWARDAVRRPRQGRGCRRPQPFLGHRLWRGRLP